MLRYLALPIVVAALAACAPAPPVAVEEEKPVAETALGLEAEGDWLGAAREYQRLAQQATGTAQQDLLLQAARAFIEGGFLGEAKETLAQVEPAPTDQERGTFKAVLQARIALKEGRYADALALLMTPPSPQLSAGLQADVYRTRAQAYAMAGNHVEEARERIRLEEHLIDPEAVYNNQERILNTLSVLSEQVLLKLRIQPPPDVMTGWMELAYIAKAHATEPGMLQAEVGRWQQRYPNHPASPQLLEQLLAARPPQLLRPQSVALLLPLQGKFAPAASAVRDGFLAAYYADSTNPAAPRVRIYDVTGADIESLYQQATLDGADFIIGPLSKEHVNALARRTDLPTPVLALNYAIEESETSSNFFQFGLSPEGEAVQVAERIWLDGHTQGVALVPEGAWGERVLQAFAGRWRQLGGRLVEVQSYAPQEKDFSEPIRQLLHIDDSEERYRRLRATLKAKVEFETRRRQDVDFVFLASFPRHARQIRPGLKFYGATDIPVYSTSHIFTGTPEPAKDRDLDGVVFGDMPWVLRASDAPNSLHRDLTGYWPAPMAAYPRLYALGIDAYRVMPYLQQLSSFGYARVAGESGSLHLDQNNRLLRDMSWARFKEGQPETVTDESSPVATGQ